MSVQTILWNGTPIAFLPGDTIASALSRAGITEFGLRQTALPAAIFCGIGQCQNCLVSIEGIGVAEACLTLCDTKQSVRSLSDHRLTESAHD